MDRSKQILRAQRDAALVRLASLQAEFDGIVEASAGANSDDEHDPEGATIAFERSRTASLMAETHLALTEIDGALDRVHQGSYGACRDCGVPIGSERLAALPATTRCVRCAGGQRGTG